MPTLEEHQLNHSTNLEVVDGLLGFDNPPNDWIVTIYFYSALHLVEKTLSEQGLHSRGHRERFDNVKSHLDQISRSYQSLYNESRQARYDCVEITSGKVAKAKRNLDAISTKLSETQGS